MPEAPSSLRGRTQPPVALFGRPAQTVPAVLVEDGCHALELIVEQLQRGLPVCTQLRRHDRSALGGQLARLCGGMLLEALDALPACLEEALRLRVDVVALRFGHAAVHPFVHEVRSMAVAKEVRGGANLLQRPPCLCSEGGAFATFGHELIGRRGPTEGCTTTAHALAEHVRDVGHIFEEMADETRFRSSAYDVE